MFTQRAALLGFVAFCFYLIAVVNTLPSFYYALTWLAMAMLGASLSVALLSLIGLACQLEVARPRAAAPWPGEEAPETAGAGPLLDVRLSNGGTLNKTDIVLELRWRDAQNEAQLISFLLEAIPSGTAIESQLPLLLPRGRYRLEGARLQGSDVLGLFRVQKRLTLPGQALEVVVGPPLLRGEGARSNAGSGARGASSRTVRGGQGESLRGTRPYAPGDDLRHIHWKSSARAGELVVKEWEQTGQETALVVWDGAANTSWGARDYDSTEWGLTLCAGLCQSWLREGTPCAFARLDAQPLHIESRALSQGELPAPLLDALAGARASRASALDAQPEPMSGARAYSNVVLVTASLGSDVGRAAARWRARGARLQVVVIDGASLGARARDRRFSKRRDRPAQNAGDASQVVSPQNYAAQVERLRALGLEVLHLQADAPSARASLARALRHITRGESTARVAS